MSLEKLVQREISRAIGASYQNDGRHINPFDTLMEACHRFYNEPVHSLAELRDRQSTKLKGDIFEIFCKLYLTHCYRVKGQKEDGLKDVWLLSEIPSEVLLSMGMKRQDLGIDLIARDGLGRLYAIQAKYRRRSEYKSRQGVGWKQLSTFYALVSRTGTDIGTGGGNKWHKWIVITNLDWVRHVGRKGSKDQSICAGTFRGLSIKNWGKMAGYKGCVLDTGEECIDVKKIRLPRLKNVIGNPSELETIRDKRIAFFCTK